MATVGASGSIYDRGRNGARVQLMLQVGNINDRRDKTREFPDHPFRSSHLTLYCVVKVDGRDRLISAQNLFPDGKFNPNAPAAAVNRVALEILTPAGRKIDNPEALTNKTPAQIDHFLTMVDQEQDLIAGRKPLFPKTLEVEGQTYKRLMINDLLDTEAAEFLRPEDVTGEHADKLQSRLRNPLGIPLGFTIGIPLGFTNVDDAKAYIKAANGQGRKFRFMTNDEFTALPKNVKDKLTISAWFIVEISRGSDRYTLRSLSTDKYNPDPPLSHSKNRAENRSIFLVED